MGAIETADLKDRSVLAWQYVAILLAEITVLGALVATAHGPPPWTYEVGWAGVGSMLIMQLYSVRRRVRALRMLGSLRGWLDYHVFCGLQAFVFVAYHSVGVSPQITLAAINFALVAVIVVTGVIGRYFYSLIPRARASDVLTYATLGPAAFHGMTPPEALRRECRGLVDLIGLDLTRRRLLRALLHDPDITPERARTARRLILIASRISALELADRLFARWIWLHRPLAFLLLGITTLHVLAHFAYAV